MEVPDYEIVDPRAESISESLRAFGYTFEAAIADLVDNSISAKSKNVHVGFDWNEGDPFLWVRDDGQGMDERTLKEAMRPGSANPLDEREAHDLGRFGLGLKTASFSQARRVTVRSRTKDGTDHTRAWDLDVVQEHNEWRLLKTSTAVIAPALEQLDGAGHGTIVVWENLDHWQTEADEHDATYGHFVKKVRDAEEHLAMTFHRFIGGSGGISLTITDRTVQAWDPFLASEKATQELSEETLRFRHQVLTVQPYVLPHISFLGGDKHRGARGPKGWNAQQGFYVYRNRRLIIAGDWLGLGFQQEEHHKLARIRVDLPNSMDAEWQLDVRKSSAIPPPGLRPDLKRIADATRAQAAKVYRHRGNVIRRRSQTDVDIVWKQVRKRDRTVFKVNRQHPLVNDLVREGGKVARDLLEVVENTIPVDSIIMANAEDPDNVAADEDYEARVSLEERALAILKMYVARGSTAQEALATMAAIEPFDRSPRLLARAEEYVGNLGASV